MKTPQGASWAALHHWGRYILAAFMVLTHQPFTTASLNELSLVAGTEYYSLLVGEAPWPFLSSLMPSLLLSTGIQQPHAG